MRNKMIGLLGFRPTLFIDWRDEAALTIGTVIEPKA